MSVINFSETASVFRENIFEKASHLLRETPLYNLDRADNREVVYNR